MANRTGNEKATRFGLGPRFLLAIAVQTMLFVALIIGIEVLALRESNQTQTSQLGSSIANTIATTAGQYLVTGLGGEMERLIAELEKNPSIAYIDFVTADGKRVAGTSRRTIPAALEEIPREGAADLIAMEKDAELHLYVRPIFAPAADVPRPSAPPSYLRLAVISRSAAGMKRQVVYTSIVVILVAMVTALVITLLGYRKIIRPILGLAESAGEIAAGNLTRRNRRLGSDEIGKLGTAFNQMAENLERTVSRITSSQEKLRGAVDLVESRSGTVSESASQQSEMVDRAYGSIEELNAEVRKITDNVESLSAASEQTSSSMLEMAASMEEVSRHTDILFGSVEETAAATHQMARSIAEVDQNVDSLQNFVTETSSSMVEMSASIGQVGANAARSYDLALAVADAAEGGMKSVRETVEGMEEIRRSVSESNAIVARLEERSSEIGKILNVIEDIAEQTNLLALNAAILAAQAGEHGRGFSVVAGQIRQLSERTARSTKEIGGLIGSVQLEVSEALQAMARGLRTAENGVHLSHEAGRSLNKILESAAKASDMGKEIAAATRQQAEGSETVSRAVSRLQELIRQLNTATTQQTVGSDHILKVVESMREMTRYVRQATLEQKSGSEMIAGSADRMIQMVHEIFHAATSQSAESEKIVKTMDAVRKIADTNRTSSGEMAAAINSLNEAIRGLHEETKKFKVQAG